MCANAEMISFERWRGRAREVMGRRAGREGFQRERSRTLRVGRWRVRGRRRGTSPADERRFLAWPRKPASLREKAKRSGDRERGKGERKERRKGFGGAQEEKMRAVESPHSLARLGPREVLRPLSLLAAKYCIKRTPSTPSDEEVDGGVVARAKQSRDGDGDEKGGEACGRDACGGIGGGTWVHAIMAMLKDHCTWP